MTQLFHLGEQYRPDGTLQLKLSVPFHPSFSGKAKTLGGTWHDLSRTWRFDLRHHLHVRQICLDIFGIDPSDPDGTQTVTVQVQADPEIFPALNGDSFWLLGRQVAHQRTRDAQPSLGEGVFVLQGGFQGGGSIQWPKLNPRDGTVLEIRSVPFSLIDATQEAAAQRGYPGAVTVTEMAPMPEYSTVRGRLLSSGAERQVVAIFSGLSQEAQYRVLTELQALLKPVPEAPDGGFEERVRRAGAMA